ncbi:amidohydrolase family protein [Sphingobium yanoikuyae]|uniref:Metal-dependent hydrolase n=1 Tax=Sphingobium yanoikuyae TaxID=13690 RepID=A0A291N0B9_SPHYA|nr:amidohydrolase family protein [Sphingobium yanoikuyae]ATI80803.1 metal-dependent hydrolase [Sphingobium yanoikuyae]
MRYWLAVLTILWTVPASSRDAAPQSSYAIIDMHFHADRPDDQGPPGSKACAPYEEWAPRDPGQPMDAYLDWFAGHPPCRHILSSPTDPAVLRDQGIAMLKRYNVLALAGGPAATVEDYRQHGDGHILAGIGFGSSGKFPSIESLRKLHAEGKLAALSEITTQYAGIAPDDPRLEPYYALAEELDIPVGIHLGPGPPGTVYFATPNYRVAAGDPLSLEPVLIRHPRLRIYAMHAGWPMGDAMIAMLFAHPQLYVDVGILDWAYPEQDFYPYLKRLIDAGFERRIMFGSDNMVWPDAIGVAIERIRKVPFLSERQKQLILHDNAARFLRVQG